MGCSRHYALGKYAQKGPEKPEIRVAKNREPEDAIFADQSHLLPKIADRVGSIFLRGISSRDFRDSEAEDYSDKRKADEDQA